MKPTRHKTNLAKYRITDFCRRLTVEDKKFLRSCNIEAEEREEYLDLDQFSSKKSGR